MVSPCSLRPIEEDELPELLRLMWDPDATGEYQWFGFRVNRSRELERRWQDEGLIADHGSSFLAVSLPDGTAAGWVTWHEAGLPGVAEIGIVLFPDHRGRGLGTEAQRQLVDYLFNTTAVHRIQAGTEVGNTAEQRALEKAGFRREGVQRGLYIRAGAWRDIAMYGVTRTDWTPPSQHRKTIAAERAITPED